MKRIACLLAILSLGVIFIGCGTNVPQKSNLNSSEIDSLYAFHLPSLIYTIAKGNKSEFNAFYSDYSLSIRKMVFDDIKPGNSVKVLPVEYSGDYKKINRYLWNVIVEMEQKKKINGIVLSDSILNFMEQKNIQYALVTFNSGFSREKGNLNKQVAKGIGVGLLTLGMAMPVPVKANTQTICYIIDRKNRNIAFYKKVSEELEPLKFKNLQSQYRSLLDSYFVVD